MLLRNTFTHVALAIVALAGLGSIWVYNLLPLNAGLATPGTPKARLQVSSSQPRILFESQAASPADNDVQYQRYLKTQMALMKSRFVLNSALLHDGIGKLSPLKSKTDPIDWLEKNLEVSSVADTELVEVSLPPRSGLSSKEQATVINAVVSAYFNAVVNKERMLMLQRQETLKKLSKSYSDATKARRETIRKLVSSASAGKTLSAPEKDALSWLHLDLRKRAVDLDLARVETEALLKRRRNSEARSGDQSQKEITQLQERLTVLEAQQKTVHQEIGLLVEQMRKADDRSNELDLSECQDDLRQIELAADKVGAAIKDLNVELQAQPRVMLVETADVK